MRKRSLAVFLIVTMFVCFVPVVTGSSADTITQNFPLAGKTYSVGDIVTFGNYWQNDTNGDGFANQQDNKEPIEWRVLAQEGNDLFLLADKGLDAQPFSTDVGNKTWEKCTLRTWLNETFYSNAFSNYEQSAIKMTRVPFEGNPDNISEKKGKDTDDKLFLLSINEIHETNYGFLSEESRLDLKKEAQATLYAKKVGADIITEGDWKGCTQWWLRTVGSETDYISRVFEHGCVDKLGTNYDDNEVAVRPAMHIDLSVLNEVPAAWTPDPNAIPATPEPTYPPTAEYVKADKTYAVGDKVSFGKYWQRDTNNYGLADQNDEKTPIEWVVLSQNGDDLFLLADKCLDMTCYNDVMDRTVVTWETSMVRKWLNNSFYNNAFSFKEKNIVKTTLVKNDPNPSYGTSSGPDTKDKVFLLSVSEIRNEEFGFGKSVSLSGDATEYLIEGSEHLLSWGRRLNSNDCSWWLRTTGANEYQTSYVSSQGGIFYSGRSDYIESNGIRPAIHIDLKALSQSDQSLSNPPQENGVYSVGDIITYGNYWQNDTNGDGKADKNDEKEPIEWRVLSQTGGKLFVLAERGLEVQAFNNGNDVAWETSSMRAWLNNTFLNDAFSYAERYYIHTTVSGDLNDKLFLLSKDDISNEMYGFKKDEQSYNNITRWLQPTDYVKELNGISGEDGFGAGNCYWWLRTSEEMRGVYEVPSNGVMAVWIGPMNVTQLSVVRPAMYIDLTMLSQTPPPEPTPIATPLVTSNVIPSPTPNPSGSTGQAKNPEKNRRKNVKVKVGKKFTWSIKVTPKKVKKLKLTINKKGKKLLKVVKRKKVKRGYKITFKAKKKGKTKIKAVVGKEKFTLNVTIKNASKKR